MGNLDYASKFSVSCVGGLKTMADGSGRFLLCFYNSKFSLRILDINSGQVNQITVTTMMAGSALWQNTTMAALIDPIPMTHAGRTDGSENWRTGARRRRRLSYYESFGYDRFQQS